MAPHSSTLAPPEWIDHSIHVNGPSQTTMMRFAKFDSNDPFRCEEVGLRYEAVHEIFLGAPLGRLEPKINPRTPESARSFIRREFGAGTFSFDAIQRGGVTSPDVCASGRIDCKMCLATDSGPLGLSSLFYLFESASGIEFWLISNGTYGRINQIFVPSLEVAVYDIYGLSVAQRAVAALAEATSTNSKVSCEGMVGVLDMPNNFGHQLINSLSGVQRLLDLDLMQELDEIWLHGTEYFGSVSDIFPETVGKIKKFPSRKEMATGINQSGRAFVRLGSNVFTAPLRDRILGRVRRRSEIASSRSPVLAVTIRAAGRQCRNLPEVVKYVYAELSSRHPSLGVLLDGFVLPQGAIIHGSAVATAFSAPYREYLDAEFRLVRDICDILPEGVVVGSTIGLPMLDAIAMISDVAFYVAHVGTLQHKLGFFTGAAGLVHGPRSQLSSPDTGHYSAELSTLPNFLSEKAVRDIPGEYGRGTGYHDYEIMNFEGILESFVAFPG